MVLVDTSVWIDTFRRVQPLDLLDVVDFEDVITCVPIIQEVLQGFAVESAFRRAREAMLNLPRVEDPMELALFLEAVDLYRTARGNGITVRSWVDCLIAACALRHDLEVVHRDRDYTALATVSLLKQRAI